MIIKTDRSLNFSIKTRKKSDIKFIIIHYTGMQSEIESLKRLKDIKSKVSCHYLINRKGAIIRMVEDNKIAWHAGKSRWKTLKDLNKNSIGIELVNRGEKFGYQNFSNGQIKSLIKLCRNLKKKYMVKKENFLGHSDIAPLRKTDPGNKFPWKRLNNHQLGNWYKDYQFKFRFNGIKKIESLFFKNLYKIGYRYFKVNKRVKTIDKIIIKSFHSIIFLKMFQVK